MIVDIEISSRCTVLTGKLAGIQGSQGTHRVSPYLLHLICYVLERVIVVDNSLGEEFNGKMVTAIRFFHIFILSIDIVI